MALLRKRQIERYSNLIESLNTLLKRAIIFVILLTFLVLALLRLMSIIF